VSERQWGTVREDYSADGDAWDYFPHDHARSRAYRWGEDGIAGISDDKQQLCFAVALWNGADPILKERLFGLSGREGNHGEDVKECYFYLDNVPSHAYMKCLYKYPQRACPYDDLVEENRRRTRHDPEYELLDTGIFDDDRYFDVFVEYAKLAPGDILIRVSAANRGPETAPLHVLPTLWFKNDWTWHPDNAKPAIALASGDSGRPVLQATHRALEAYSLHCDPADHLLFTDNESNLERLFGTPNASPYVKTRSTMPRPWPGGRRRRPAQPKAAHYCVGGSGADCVIRLRRATTRGAALPGGLRSIRAAQARPMPSTAA
jgi:hypothetical protein